MIGKQTEEQMTESATIKNEIESAIHHLDTYGYCILADRMPVNLAAEISERCLEMHDDSRYQDYNSGAPHESTTMSGMYNLDDRVWQFMTHPDVLAVAHYFLGSDCRVTEVCAKPIWPGSLGYGLHVDEANFFHKVPNVPWLINTMWMLTDFTENNGATAVVPMSHKCRFKFQPTEIPFASPLVKVATGQPGSVLLWHGGTLHTATPNTGDQIRVGLNIAYHARWFNHYVNSHIEPIWPETYVRMPPEMQKLFSLRRGRTKSDVYEID